MLYYLFYIIIFQNENKKLIMLEKKDTTLRKMSSIVSTGILRLLVSLWFEPDRKTAVHTVSLFRIIH